MSVYLSHFCNVGAVWVPCSQFRCHDKICSCNESLFKESQVLVCNNYGLFNGCLLKGTYWRKNSEEFLQKSCLLVRLKHIGHIFAFAYWPILNSVLALVNESRFHQIQPLFRDLWSFRLSKLKHVSWLNARYLSLYFALKCVAIHIINEWKWDSIYLRTFSLQCISLHCCLYVIFASIIQTHELLVPDFVVTFSHGFKLYVMQT